MAPFTSTTCLISKKNSDCFPFQCPKNFDKKRGKNTGSFFLFFVLEKGISKIYFMVIPFTIKLSSFLKMVGLGMMPRNCFKIL